MRLEGGVLEVALPGRGQMSYLGERFAWGSGLGRKYSD